MKKLFIGVIFAFFVCGTSCYAQSNVTLARFKERYNEIMTDGFQGHWGAGSSAAWASYAGSNVSLSR